MRVLKLCLMSLIIFGCSSNKGTGFLQKKDFDGIFYSSLLNPKEFKKLGDHDVQTRGFDANIESTVPKLFLEIKNKYGSDVYISKLKFKTFSRKESFQVPYETCHNELQTRTEYQTESYQTCSTNYQGHQFCTMQTRSNPKTVTENVKKCQTDYKTEMKDVLYQRASASVYRKGS